ncbi:hypothetical protein BDD12DRAFT_721931 [Trichophaea hybrida]|nr:hypothetical protein BDD12DRAFT_721931 [Trichophaea hybrida]
MGVNKTTIKPGNEKDFPKISDIVWVHYDGQLENGTVFDSTRTRGIFATTIGLGHVIKGWDEGIPQMSLGEKAKLYVTHDYAYGER